MDNIEVREILAENEIKEAIKLVSEAFRNSYSYNAIEKFFSLLKFHDYPARPRLLGAFYEGKIVGCLYVQTLWYTNFYNSHLAVDERYRLKGIARKIEDTFLKMIFENIFPDAESASITLLAMNPEIHKKLGYEFSDLQDEDGNFLGIKKVFREQNI